MPLTSFVFATCDIVDVFRDRLMLLLLRLGDAATIADSVGAHGLRFGL